LIVFERGTLGEVYNLGGGAPRTNLDVTERLMALCDRSYATHAQHVTDRPGHDRRYALDCTKAHGLGWAPNADFTTGLGDTVAWYRENQAWWRPIRSGAFAEYARVQYAGRGKA
jgi:dTDP-glucose 4,6-dehydratase